MTRPDPLLSAAATYVGSRWQEDEWREFGRATGTSDIIRAHPRLYRSLSFGDLDYPDAAEGVLDQIFSEIGEYSPGEKGRMELLSASMPDLPEWIDANAPGRTKHLFSDYILGRDSSEIPVLWREQIGLSATEPESASSPVPEATTIPEVTPWDLLIEEDEAPLSNELAPIFLVKDVEPARENSIFIVHGHDEAALNSIRIFVHKITGLMPISLAEEPGRGATIIEKFERSGAIASFVIVLLTPDDVGQTVDNHQKGVTPLARARQNVVLELGYFIGKIGRENIVVVDADVERPSDLAGLSYVSYPDINWKENLRVELAAANLT